MVLRHHTQENAFVTPLGIFGSWLIAEKVKRRMKEKRLGSQDEHTIRTKTIT